MKACQSRHPASYFLHQTSHGSLTTNSRRAHASLANRFVLGAPLRLHASSEVRRLDRSSQGRAVRALDELAFPIRWSDPKVASEKAQWLQTSLHQWLDNEFCPEPPNGEISRRCAQVLERCLLEQQLESGEVLMAMVRNLEQFSFKESFHGPFSAANAAMKLLLENMEREAR